MGELSFLDKDLPPLSDNERYEVAYRRGMDWHTNHLRKDAESIIQYARLADPFEAKEQVDAAVHVAREALFGLLAIQIECSIKTQALSEATE